jgi:1-aminocyclopropane-1-carboxylate deaminase/D-cysteine desulfhydrase-like pyridoxal-dependent ACC family enzyme
MERVPIMPSSAFRRIPRVSLAHLPTPISPVAPAAWPHGDLYLKHDDLTGSALSGNKVRKLEYLLADARAARADTLVTWGAVQSNCARAVAVAAAMTGFRCVLVLAGAEPPEDDGNLLIARLTGAEVVFEPAANPAGDPAAVGETLGRLRRAGARPYPIPFGGSSTVGTLGYVRAGLELGEQLAAAAGGGADRAVRNLLVPVASGGTYAGLFIGLRLAGLPLRLVGAYVLGEQAAWVTRLTELIRATSERFGLGVTAGPQDIRLIDACGAGYGQPTLAEAEFIASFARRTGVLLDPVYTGKALYAADQALRRGDAPLQGGLLFFHTGGTFGLFPHRGLLRQALAGRASAANAAWSANAELHASAGVSATAATTATAGVQATAELLPA